MYIARSLAIAVLAPWPWPRPALAQRISFSSGIGCCVFYVTNIDPAAPK